ncbi:MAG: hypothetical protein JOY99_12180 [Sphingomonadaceae bacterium]|nr:hypothetical protein [Sphingomonadaceae bacterium]
MIHVSTAAGPVSVEDLGCTLMQEHVTLKMAGSEANTLHPGPKRTEMVARTLDWVAEIKARGVSTIVDPAPGDMGRDLELCAELGARAGLNIVRATGLFNKYHGGSAEWTLKRDIRDDGKPGRLRAPQCRLPNPHSWHQRRLQRR